MERVAGAARAETLRRIDRWSLALLFFAGCNLVRFLALRGTLDNTLFQADYALPPVALWVATRWRWPRPAAAAVTLLAVVAAMAGDIIGITSRMYMWVPDEVFDYLGAARDLPWGVIAPILGAAVLGAAAVAASLFARRGAGFAIWPLVVTVGALAAIDIGGGTSFNLHRQGDDKSRYNVLVSGVLELANGRLHRWRETARVYPFAGATMAGELGSAPPRQILSVAVESYGLAKRQVDADALIAPLIDGVRGAYAVTRGVHRFHGSTLQGELRELCGLESDGVPKVTAIARLRARCLPLRLAHAGWDTVGMHGNGGSIYDRTQVYPLIGFRHRAFYDDLKAGPGGPACPGTAFNGVCDARLLGMAVARFDGRPRFVHAMTLDAHLPMRRDAARGGCPPVFADTPALCTYAAVTRSTFAALARALVASQHRPDLVVIYGDHMPPFASAVRNRFNDHLVPVVVLHRLPGVARPH